MRIYVYSARMVAYMQESISTVHTLLIAMFFFFKIVSILFLHCSHHIKQQCTRTLEKFNNFRTINRRITYLTWMEKEHRIEHEILAIWLLKNNTDERTFRNVSALKWSIWNTLKKIDLHKYKPIASCVAFKVWWCSIQKQEHE